MDFFVRAMQDHDIDRVVELAAESVEAPPWARRDYAQLLPPVAMSLMVAAPFVAQRGDSLVGFAVARWLRGESVAEIENVLVARPHRRQGIATALVKACIQWAAAAGAAAVRLEVRESNAAALALYRGLGFVSVGLRRAYYTGPVEAALILEKPAVAHSSRSLA